MAGMLARYEALIAAGELRPDPEQRAAAERLDALQRELESADAQARPARQAIGRKAEHRRAASICGAASGAASRC